MRNSGKPKIKSIVLIGQHLVDRYGRGPHRVVKWVDTLQGVLGGRAWRPVINALRTRHSTDKAPVTIHGREGVMWAEAPAQPAVRHGTAAGAATRARSRWPKRRTQGAVVRFPAYDDVEFMVIKSGEGITQVGVDTNDANAKPWRGCGTSKDDVFLRWMTRAECRRFGIPYVNRSPKRAAPAKAKTIKTSAVYTPREGDVIIVVGSALFAEAWKGAVGTVERLYDAFAVVMHYAPNNPRFKADAPPRDRRCSLGNPDPDVRLATAEERHAASMAAPAARSERPKVGERVKVSDIRVGDRLLNEGLRGYPRVVTSLSPLSGFYLDSAQRVMGLETRDYAYTYDGPATAEERAKAGLPPEPRVDLASTPLVYENRLARRARLAHVLEDPIVQAALTEEAPGPTKAERIVAILAAGSTARKAPVLSAEDVWDRANLDMTRPLLSRQDVAAALTDLINRGVVRYAAEGPSTAGRTGPFVSLDLSTR